MLPTQEKFLANGGLAPCSEAFNDECAICQADARENEVNDPVTLPCDCKYTYCRECILHWLTSDSGKAKCPICKQKFFQTIDADEDDLDEFDEDEEFVEPVMETYGLPVQTFHFVPGSGRRAWGIVGATDPSAVIAQMDDIMGEIMDSLVYEDVVIGPEEQCQVRLEYLIDALIYGSNDFDAPLNDNDRIEMAQLAIATYHVLEGMEGQRYSYGELTRALITGVLGQFEVSPDRMEGLIRAAFDWYPLDDDDVDEAYWDLSIVRLFGERVLIPIARDARLIAVWADRQGPDDQQEQ